MARSHFQLVDVEVPRRWYLNGLFDGTGRELDSRFFTYGFPVELVPSMRIPSYEDGTIIDALPPLQVGTKRRGKPLDFTFTTTDMPVVTAKTAALLSTVADEDIQRIPALLARLGEEYEIINVVSRVPCIDPVRSNIMWWTEADGRPDKIGKPQMITKLVIDPERVIGHHIFRPEGWEVVVIVSDVVKEALEKARVSGVKFSKV
jgi:hypothetical protein